VRIEEISSSASAAMPQSLHPDYAGLHREDADGARENKT
jgi:hypothetical protein